MLLFVRILREGGCSWFLLGYEFFTYESRAFFISPFRMSNLGADSSASSEKPIASDSIPEERKLVAVAGPGCVDVGDGVLNVAFRSSTGSLSSSLLPPFEPVDPQVSPMVVSRTVFNFVSQGHFLLMSRVCICFNLF